jgi:hypothetical protein
VATVLPERISGRDVGTHNQRSPSPVKRLFVTCWELVILSWGGCFQLTLDIDKIAAVRLEHDI